MRACPRLSLAQETATIEISAAATNLEIEYIEDPCRVAGALGMVVHVDMIWCKPQQRMRSSMSVRGRM